MTPLKLHCLIILLLLYNYCVLPFAHMFMCLIEAYLTSVTVPLTGALLSHALRQLEPEPVEDK